MLFSGDLVEYGATPYTGDAYLKDWPETLARLRGLGPEKLVPGRGAALKTQTSPRLRSTGPGTSCQDVRQRRGRRAAPASRCKRIYDETFAALEPEFGNWVIFEHCMPFDVSRAYDEASGVADPRIWTAERDVEMWRSLEQDQPMKNAEA